LACNPVSFEVHKLPLL